MIYLHIKKKGKYGVSSVAVLGHMGIVLGNISMTDVKVRRKRKNMRL